MADVTIGSSTVSTDAMAYYIARRMFELSERNLVLGRYATRYELPQRMGTTLRAVRVGRLVLPTAPLTEGVAPDSVAFSITNRDVTVQQWGMVVRLTDVAEITTVHPMLTAAIERTSLAMSEMFEREMAQTLMTGTNVTYAASKTTRNDLNSTTVLTTAEIIGIVTTLRRRGAIPIKGPLYGGVLPPQLEADMMGEDKFQAAVARGQDLERLDFAKIGVWMGAEWVRSNFLPYFRGELAATSASADSEKAKIISDGTGTALWSANAVINVVVVGRDANSGYERTVSQDSAYNNGATNTNLKITVPTDTNYIYDVYVPSAADGTAPRFYTSKVGGAAEFSVTALPSSAAKAPPVAPADDKEAFVAFLFGKDAWGRVELNGMSLQAYLTPKGPSDSDPLAQRRKVGAKVMWNSWILDDTFFQRFEAGSAYAAGLP